MQKSSARKNQVSKRVQTLRVPHPPSFQSTFQVAKVLRFIASAALVNVDISFVDLLDLVVMATSATAGYQLFSAFKLGKVSIWGPMAAALTPVTASIEYSPIGTAGIGGPQRIWSDTSMGATEAAYVSKAPPKESAQSKWQTDNAGTAFFRLNGPIGSIVDLAITYVMQNGQTPQVASTVLAGATVGQIYVRALDSNGATLLTPVSYPTK